MGSTRSASQSSGSSSSSSTTVSDSHDIESQKYRNKRGYFAVVFDQTGINDDVLRFPYPGHGTGESPYVIDFLPDDAHRAMKFPWWKKWMITTVQAIATLAVTFVSSGYVGGVIDIMKEFEVSTTVAILGISLFVLGFAIGPLFWAPMSEMYGRQYVFFWTYMVMVAFNGASAGAPNMASLVIFRFLAGAFGSSVLTNAGGVIADMFEAKERGLALAGFALAPFLGPALGPIAGGFLGEAAGWRWVEGLMTIFTGVLWILGALFIPETYAPVLLRRRAAALSKKTGKVYISKLDVGKETKSLGKELRVGLSRPWIMLFYEPIVSLLSIYMAIIFATLYMCFAAFPIVFQQHRGWNVGVSGLAFLGVAVGMVLGVVYTILVDNKRYAKVVEANGGKAPPEARLPTAVIGSVLIPVGFFWFAWTSSSSIHWIVPIFGSGVFGLGMVFVFLSLFNYLVDSYVIFAASVLAAGAVLRAVLAAAFPLFTPQMYKTLGVHWASSVPAFLALACIPFPYLFYRFGEQIRMKCRFATEAAVVLEKMMQQHHPAAGGQAAEEDGEVIDEDEAMEEVERRVTEEKERRKSHASHKGQGIFGR